jgi:UDP-glucose 4-epimerase
MRAPSTLLVTGGAGFLGSHACVELLDHGYKLIVVDDYSGGAPQVFARVERIAGRFVGAVYELDIRDRRALSAVFDRHPVDAVLHFAGFGPGSTPVRTAIEHYDTGIGGTTALLRAMEEHGVRRLIHSSSCAVADIPDGPLGGRTAAVRNTSPLTSSQAVCERLLADVCARHSDCTVLCLRLANPAGAHPSGLLGEDPRGGPGALMPHLARVAVGRLPALPVHGADHPTPDGTPVRDYIHVMDAVEAYRLALDHLDDAPGMHTFDVGRGRGVSVLEMVAAFSRACGKPLPYEFAPRRPGSASVRVTDPGASARAWGWRPTRDLDTMCRDAWRFARLNPQGYAGSGRRIEPLQC